MSQRPRVALVEDQTIFRQILAEVLRASQRVQVVGEYGSGEEALPNLISLPLDLVLLDAILPDMRGLELMEHLKAKKPRLPVILVTAHARPALVQEALAAGVRGVVAKSAPFHELESCVERVLAGGRSFCSVTTGLLAEVLANPTLGEDLTPRQSKVVELVARGLSSKEIAEALSISEKTVQNHRLQIREKLNIHDVAGLTRYAIERGLIEPRA